MFPWILASCRFTRRCQSFDEIYCLHLRGFVLSLHTLKFEIRTLYYSIATFFTAVKSVNVIYSVCTATSCLSIKIMRHGRKT